MLTEFRVLTYNVHSCRGADGRADPARIAAVIAPCKADVIALQEIDVGRLRTSNVDQALQIAQALGMQSHFYPALHVGEEKYGDAILTSLPLKVIKAGALPSIGEPRGGLIARVTLSGTDLLVATTHLGLRRGERRRQVDALLGPDWLGISELKDLPTVLLGDLNATPGSMPYRRLMHAFEDAQRASWRRRQPTFPARLPVLRIDHVLIRNGLVSRGARVIDSALARVASDHLPVLATLAIPQERTVPVAIDASATGRERIAGKLETTETVFAEHIGPRAVVSKSSE